MIPILESQMPLIQPKMLDRVSMSTRVAYYTENRKVLQYHAVKNSTTPHFINIGTLRMRGSVQYSTLQFLQAEWACRLFSLRQFS